MSEHAIRRHVAAEHDAAAQRDHRCDLAQRIIRIAPVMAAVDDLDADRAGIDVLFAGPAGDAGMPGALALRHALHDAAILQHDVMCGDLGAGGAELGDGALDVGHAGVMQHDHVGLPVVGAFAEIHRRDDVGDDRGVRSKGLHVGDGPRNGKGALTLRISRRERTRRHPKSQIQNGSPAISGQPPIYYSFTLPRVQSHRRHPANFRSACGWCASASSTCD